MPQTKKTPSKKVSTQKAKVVAPAKKVLPAKKVVSVKKTMKATATPKSPKSRKSMNWWQCYEMDRDQFFVSHPNARILLGLFVVSLALYIAILIRVDYVTKVSAMMEAEGMNYNAQIIPWLGW